MAEPVSGMRETTVLDRDEPVTSVPSAPIDTAQGPHSWVDDRLAVSNWQLKPLDPTKAIPEGPNDGLVFSFGSYGGHDAMMGGIRLEQPFTLVDSRYARLKAVIGPTVQGGQGGFMVDASAGLRGEFGTQGINGYISAQGGGNVGVLPGTASGELTYGGSFRGSAGFQLGPAYVEGAHTYGSNITMTSVVGGVRFAF